MNSTHRFARRDGVASEVIEGEAVIIDLESGVYYSLDKVGGRIWALLLEGRCLDEVGAAVVAEYLVDEETARRDLERLVAQLVEERLLEAQTAGPAPAGAPAGPAGPTRREYSAPELVAYRDMEDLLALDPPAPGIRDIPWRSKP